MDQSGGIRRRNPTKPSESESLPGQSEAEEVSGTELRPAPVRFYIPLNVALILLVTSYTLSALYAPILDCDETFNYWEPLHFLLHGSGFETWEYSPQYAIRSWAYIILHALPLAPSTLLSTSRATQFYLLRGLLAFFSAALFTRLYSAVSRNLHPRIGLLYLLISLVSPGFFHASTAFLPSSFAMYFSALGLASFLSSPAAGVDTRTIAYFGVGALLGWPFSGALVLPLLAGEWLAAFRVPGALFRTLVRNLNGVAVCLAILAAQIGIDSFFYQRLVVVPFRIVFYNVLNSSSASGPNIFGTEPWHYYIRNLLLNFNLFFLAAVASLPLLLLLHFVIPPSGQSTTASDKSSALRTPTLLSPFYLWLAIFTLQPHKEERFMYPAYPFLALNGAVGLHLLFTLLFESKGPSLAGRVPAGLKSAAIFLPLVLAVVLCVLRTLSITTSYSAPLNIYEHIPQQSVSADTTTTTVGVGGTTTTTTTTICLGKDWYRFPTSFLLPDGVAPDFIQSQFDGLLPGHFSNSTWQMPAGMNDANQFDARKVVDVGACDYLVDSSFPSAPPTELEPDYAAAAGSRQTWERVKCLALLDSASTGFVGRVVWLPDWSVIPARWRRRWGEHCLLRRG